MTEEISLIEEKDGKTIVHITSSHLNEYQSCPQKYDYSMVQNLRMITTPRPLSRGSFMHKVLEWYYKGKLLRKEKDSEYANLDHGEIIQKAILNGRFYAVKNNVESVDVNETLERLELYFKKYYDDGWEPLFVEQPFSKILFDSDKLLVLYEGQIDLVVRNRSGSIIFTDHKSESRKSEPVSFLNQFTGYAWVGETERFVVNKIGFQSSIKDVDKVLRRIELHIPFEKQEEWVTDTLEWVHEILDSKNKNHWKKNRTNCDKYGRCVYLPLCEASKTDRELIKAQAYKVSPPHDPMGTNKDDDD